MKIGKAVTRAIGARVFRSAAPRGFVRLVQLDDAGEVLAELTVQRERFRAAMAAELERMIDVGPTPADRAGAELPEALRAPLRRLRLE